MGKSRKKKKKKNMSRMSDDMNIKLIHSSADTILSSSAFARVQNSAPYMKTVHTSERTDFIFRPLIILLSL